MDAIRCQSPDGRLLRIEPAGDLLRFTEYSPAGDRIKSTDYHFDVPTSNAAPHYAGQAPVPGDLGEALEMPSMNFEPPRPKPVKADKEPSSGRAPRPHYAPPTNNEEPLALPSMGW